MSARPRRGDLLAAGASALVAGVAWRRREHVPGGAARWQRTNHRGEPISMLEGPAWTVGALAGIAVAPGLRPGVRAGAALAVAAGGVFGAVDDLTERGSTKGLRGHLGALARGDLTTGGLKVLGIGVTGVLSAATVLTGADRRGRLAAAADTLVAGGVVAGSANLANLLDLRPGRALKVVALAAPLLAGHPGSRPLAAAALGASAAVAAPDLGERSMLGDCGANAAGALLGAAVVARTADGGRRGRLARAGVLAGLLGLTLASERVSFTRVIEATPGLRELDALGRRPPAPPA